MTDLKSNSSKSSEIIKLEFQLKVAEQKKVRTARAVQEAWDADNLAQEEIDSIKRYLHNAYQKHSEYTRIVLAKHGAQPASDPTPERAAKGPDLTRSQWSLLKRLDEGKVIGRGKENVSYSWRDKETGLTSYQSKTTEPLIQAKLVNEVPGPEGDYWNYRVLELTAAGRAALSGKAAE